MRRPRGAVGGEPGQLALALDQRRVGVEDVGKLAMQADADMVGEFRMAFHDGARGSHDELEMGDVVAVFRTQHQELVLRRGFAVEPIAAIEHENLERRHAVFEREIFHLVEVFSFDRRHVIAVVDPEPSLRQLAHFGHDFAIRAAAVEIILTGADVVQAGGDAAHRGGLALAHRVLGERAVDADMHMRVDAAGKGQQPFGVEHFGGVLGADVRRKPDHLAVLDGDVEAIHAGVVRTHHARILDDEIEDFIALLAFIMNDVTPLVEAGFIHPNVSSLLRVRPPAAVLRVALAELQHFGGADQAD